MKRLPEVTEIRLARREVWVVPEGSKRRRKGNPSILLYLCRQGSTLGVKILPHEDKETLLAHIRAFAEALGVHILPRDEEKPIKQVPLKERNKNRLYYAELSNTALAEELVELERLAGTLTEEENGGVGTTIELVKKLISRLKDTIGMGSGEQDGT
jgi:hypothetical protein